MQCYVYLWLMGPKWTLMVIVCVQNEMARV